MSRIQSSTIRDAITAFYEMAEVPRPSAQRCVAPLVELIESLNLNYVELANLTSQRAIHSLLQQGGLMDPLEESNQDPPRESGFRFAQLAGFLYATANAGVIFVERKDLLVRRRFSAAHELGHYWLHFRPHFTALDADGSPVIKEALDAFPHFESEPMPDALPIAQSPLGHATSAAEFEQREREANQFAVELLMPETIVREVVTQYLPHFRGDDLVWRLATEMLVSGATMRWRLQNLGWLPSKSATLN